jgi:hypothetical protein
MNRQKAFKVRPPRSYAPVISTHCPQRAYIGYYQNKNGNRNKFGDKRRDRGPGGGGQKQQPVQGERGNYTSITTENALYERFYKESNILPEEEWNDFWNALKRTLPTTFRFTGSRGCVEIYY